MSTHHFNYFGCEFISAVGHIDTAPDASARRAERVSDAAFVAAFSEWLRRQCRDVRCSPVVPEMTFEFADFRNELKLIDRTGCNLENSPTFMPKSCFLIAALLGTGRLRAAETNSAAQAWFTRPLSLGECLDLALKQNSAILKGQSDLEAAYGMVVQTRAIAIPKLRATANYEFNNALESLQLPPPTPPVAFQQEQSWSPGLRVVQSILV